MGGPDDRLIDSDPTHCPPMVMDAAGVAWVTFAARMAVIAMLLLAGGSGGPARRHTGAGHGVDAGLRGDVGRLTDRSGELLYGDGSGGDLCAAVAGARGDARAARFVAWTPVVFVWLHYCALPITGRVGLLGLGATYWVLTCLALVAIGRRNAGGATDPLREPNFARRPHSSDALAAETTAHSGACMTGDWNRPFLSIVVPAHNEELRLPRCLTLIEAFLKTQPYQAEVLIVENGSHDRTLEIARDFAATRRWIRSLQVDGRGKGQAVRAGMLAAQGDFRFMCDVDLSMPIEEVVRFLPPLFARLRPGHRLAAGRRGAARW